MKFLLDSCAFLDIATGAPTLTQETISTFQAPEHEIAISVASIWELGLKKSIGKLDFDINGAIDLLPQNGISIIDITLPVTLLVNELPYHHKDPFDRIIIATAKVHNINVITSDEIFKIYGLEVLSSR